MAGALDDDAHVSETFQDTVAVDATLGPLGGEVFRTVFEDLVQVLFEAEWAEAEDRSGPPRRRFAGDPDPP